MTPERMAAIGRRAGIQAFVTARDIRRLYHFSRVENLAGIAMHGLLPQELLLSRGLPCAINDHLRWDGHADAISVSISFPNYKMFYRLRCEQGGDWAVLELEPSILWEMDCAFYATNAAAGTMANITVETARELQSLFSLFEAEDLSGRPRGYVLDTGDPTDPQAEVMVFSSIPIGKIVSVAFISA